MNFSELNWFDFSIKKLKKALDCINHVIYTCVFESIAEWYSWVQIWHSSMSSDFHCQIHWFPIDIFFFLLVLSDARIYQIELPMFPIIHSFNFQKSVYLKTWFAYVNCVHHSDSEMVLIPTDSNTKFTPDSWWISSTLGGGRLEKMRGQGDLKPIKRW